MNIQQIENELNEMMCSHHNQHAKVSIQEQGSGHNIQVQNSCCSSFTTEVSEKGSYLITQGVADDITNALKW